MRSLFFKIYIWFWVTVVLIGLALLISFIITPPDQLIARWRKQTSVALKLYAQTGVEILERDGKAQVDSYLKRLEGDSIIQAVLLDSQNREVAGSATVDGAQELAAKAISGNQAEVSVTGIATLAAHP